MIVGVTEFILDLSDKVRPMISVRNNFSHQSFPRFNIFDPHPSTYDSDIYILSPSHTDAGDDEPEPTVQELWAKIRALEAESYSPPGCNWLHAVKNSANCNHSKRPKTETIAPFTSS